MSVVPTTVVRQWHDVKTTLFLLGAAAVYALAGNIPFIGYAVMLILIAGIIYRVANVELLQGFIEVSLMCIIVLGGTKIIYGASQMKLFISFIFEAGGAAFFIGAALQKGIIGLRALAFGAAMPFLFFVLLLINSFGMRDLYDGIFDEVREVYTESISKNGIELDDRQSMHLEKTLAFTQQIFPAAIFLSSILSLLIAYRLLQAIALRFKFKVSALPLMRYWRMPFWPVWILLVIIVGVLWGGDIMQDALRNLLLIVSIIYFTAGITIIRHVVAVRKIAPFMEYLFYLTVLMLLPFSGIIIALLGLFDVWFNFRKLNITT